MKITLDGVEIPVKSFEITKDSFIDGETTFKSMSYWNRFFVGILMIFGKKVFKTRINFDLENK